MIEKIRIKGYRKLRDLTIIPNEKLNILVGENEAGKSTLFEAITLALTGRVNGRTAQDELNPYWFNQQNVEEFFRDRAEGNPKTAPRILIEIYLKDDPSLLKRFFGAVNSSSKAKASAGIVLEVLPDEQYETEIETYFSNSSELALIPVEYYRVEWRTFGNISLTNKPKEITASVIDSSTVRSSSGVDYHLRQMLSTHIHAEDKARVSLAFRTIKDEMTKGHLSSVNEQMKELAGTFADKPLSLAMDQSSRTSWDVSISPHIAELPFGMAGQGQQAAVKIALAVARTSDSANIVMIEEPENHQSHTRLNMLIKQITDLSGMDQQVFVTTHSSFVLNRLGLDSLLLISNGGQSRLTELTEKTGRYFQKLPGYDTLRMVLGDKIVLVEGPSDEILFERFYKDRYSRMPVDDGIDVISMRGLATKRCLELLRSLNKSCAVLIDSDGVEPSEIQNELGSLISEDRQIFIGPPDLGETLEPQLRGVNSEELLRKVLNIRSSANLGTWMRNNKTEGALRIAESAETLSAPRYFTEAFEFIRGL